MPTPDADSATALPLTHSPTLRRLLYEALGDLGLDPADIYRRVFQHRRHLFMPADGRLKHDDAPLFWEAAEVITGDRDIGLHLGEQMKPRMLDVVGYLLLASRDQMEHLLDDIGQQDPDPALTEQSTALGEQLRQLRQGSGDTPAGGAPATAASPAPTALSNALAVWHVSLRMGADALRNGLDPMSFIRYLDTLGE
eukprot:gene5561-6920_t